MAGDAGGVAEALGTEDRVRAAVAEAHRRGAPVELREPAQLGDFINALDGVTKPVCIIWGDQDHAAPPEVQAMYRAVPARMKNVEVHIVPGVQHGYMMPGGGKAFDQKTRDFSMERALAILSGLRDDAKVAQRP